MTDPPPGAKPAPLTSTVARGTLAHTITTAALAPYFLRAARLAVCLALSIAVFVLAATYVRRLVRSRGRRDHRHVLRRRVRLGVARAVREVSHARPQAEDLTGRVFGKWTVLRRARVKMHGSTMWRCRCGCGRVSPVAAYALKHGRSARCHRCASSRPEHREQARTISRGRWRRDCRGCGRRFTAEVVTHFYCSPACRVECGVPPW
jgi:hypothetical protein